MKNETSKSKRRNLPDQERKEMILAAALTAFATYGYETCNVDAIAEIAGIGKGTIYRHYPSQLELFAAVVEQGHERLLRRFEPILTAECTVSEHMAMGLRQFVDFFVEYPDFYRVMMIEQPEVRLSVSLDMDAGYQHFLKAIIATVKEDIRIKKIKKVDPEFAAQIFLSVMKLIVERQLFSKGHSRTKDIKDAVAITLKGLEI